MINGLFHHLVLTLRLNFRSKQAMIYGYVVPVFFLLAFGFYYHNVSPPLLRHMGQLLTITILGGACFGMPTTMVAERERGVWRRYRLLPAASGGLILSAVVGRFLIVLTGGLLQVLLAHFVFANPFPAQPLQLLIIFGFAAFAFMGLGLIIAMLAADVPAVQALGQAIFLPMIILGGVGVPLTNFTGGRSWLRLPASFLPGRYSVEALDACLIGGGGGLPASHFPVAALLLIGLAAYFAGANLFRWDAGQRIARGAKVWVGVALAAWAMVGIAAAKTNRLVSSVDKPIEQHQSPARQKAGPSRIALTALPTTHSEAKPPATNVAIAESSLIGATTQSAINAVTQPATPTTAQLIDEMSKRLSRAEAAVQQLADESVELRKRLAAVESQRDQMREILAKLTPGGLGTITPATGPASVPAISVAIAAATHPTSMPAIPTTIAAAATVPTTRAVKPEDKWKLVTDAQLEAVTYDDLPSDQDTVTPLAKNLDNLDEDGKKRMDTFEDNFSDWKLFKDEQNVCQKVRYALSAASVADNAQDQHEGEIAYIVMDQIRRNVPEDELKKAVGYIILHPDEGLVVTNIKDLGVEGDVVEDAVRERLRDVREEAPVSTAGEG